MARPGNSGSRADSIAFAICAGLAFLITLLPTHLQHSLASSFRGSVLAPLVALQGHSERLRNAIRSYGRATATLDSLTLRVLELEDLRLENERLRHLLGLGPRLGWGFVAAEVLGQGAVSDRHSVVLTVGARSGVARGSVVVTPEGIVGVVTDVEDRTSVAMLWSHPDFRASAMAGDGAIFGIVQPHLGSGAGRYLLELRGAPYRTVLPAGTLLRTSGLGGVFPRGVPIGTVIAELKSYEGWARSYLVRPAVTPAQLDGVMVLLRPRASDDLSAVWGARDSIVASDTGKTPLVPGAANDTREGQRVDSLSNGRNGLPFGRP